MNVQKSLFALCLWPLTAYGIGFGGSVAVPQPKYVPGQILLTYEDQKNPDPRGEAIQKNHTHVISILSDRFDLALREEKPFRPVHSALINRMVNQNKTESEDQAQMKLKRISNKIQRLKTHLKNKDSRLDKNRKNKLKEKIKELKKESKEIKKSSKTESSGLSRQIILFLEDSSIDIPSLCDKLTKDKLTLEGTGILIKNASPNHIYRTQNQ